MKWLWVVCFHLPRPGFGWLSASQVYAVHAKLRHLFWKAPQRICAPEPLYGTFAIAVKTSDAAGPRFEFAYSGSRYRLWLECHHERYAPRVHFQKDDEEIQVISLSDARCGLLRRLLRGLHGYFPLYPSEDDVVYIDGAPQHEVADGAR